MSRTDTALDVLRDGGHISYLLIHNDYTGISKFGYRLYDKNNVRVKGFGFKTFFALDDAGMLKKSFPADSSSWTTIYKLKD